MERRSVASMVVFLLGETKKTCYRVLGLVRRSGKKRASL